MFTFIELQGFSKRRPLLLPDDEFRAFQRRLLKTLRQGILLLVRGDSEKFAGVALVWVSAAVFGLSITT